MHTPPIKDFKPARVSTRHSPCVGVCQIDKTTGWCIGCGRTGNEIGSWLGLGDEERLALWAELPKRLDKLAVQAHLMPWNREELARWVRATLTEGDGTWVTGVPGAVAEFPSGVRRNLAVAIQTMTSLRVRPTPSSGFGFTISSGLSHSAATDRSCSSCQKPGPRFLLPKR